MRRNHQKRLLATRSKQDPDTYYGTDDFRATSAGDSTLRVSERCKSSLFLLTCSMNPAGSISTFCDIRIGRWIAAVDPENVIEASVIGRMHRQRTIW